MTSTRKKAGGVLSGGGAPRQRGGRSPLGKNTSNVSGSIKTAVCVLCGRRPNRRGRCACDWLLARLIWGSR